MANCNLCGSSSVIRLLTLQNAPESAQAFVNPVKDIKEKSIDLIIGKCKVCEHVQSLTGPIENYRDVITAASLSPTICNHRMKVIKRIEKRYIEGSPVILEVGAGRGDFVKYLKKEGYNYVAGIESNRKSVQNAQREEANIIEGYILDHKIDNLIETKANIVLCFNFLEHVPNPYDFMKELENYCEPGCILYFTVPSIEFILKNN